MPPQHGLPGLDVSLPFSSAPVSHLFLVLPGLGDPYQHHPPFHTSLESNLRLLQANTSPSLLFLPLDWHTSAAHTWRLPLHPFHPPTAVRAAVADTAGDLLLLASPFWRLSIARRLADQARAQLAAVRRNRPAFSGRVSLLAHSVSALLAVELVHHRLLPALRLDAVILLGAPLAAYAALAPDSGKQTCLATVRTRRHDLRFVNVFHPLDPVAYRLEPFVRDDQEPVRDPVRVRPHSRSFWDDAALFWDDIVDNLSRADLFAMFARRAPPTRAADERQTAADERVEKHDDGRPQARRAAAAGLRRSSSYVCAEPGADARGGESAERDGERASGTGGSEVLLSDRIDYELQDGMGVPLLDVMASWGAIKAHAYYWKSADVAQIILDVAATSEEAFARRRGREGAVEGAVEAGEGRDER